jgi:hypothetical protein
LKRAEEAGISAPQNRTMENPEQKRQNQVRHRVLKGVQIVFKGHEAAIDCVVRNLSNGGACLNVESSIGIPDSFDLLLDHAFVGNCPRDLAESFAKSALNSPKRFFWLRLDSSLVRYGNRTPNQTFRQPLKCRSSGNRALDRAGPRLDRPTT